MISDTYHQCNCGNSRNINHAYADDHADILQLHWRLRQQPFIEEGRAER